jgi:UDP-N-acetylglucosamine 2-epimerase (non-hydrolysing)
MVPWLSATDDGSSASRRRPKSLVLDATRLDRCVLDDEHSWLKDSRRPVPIRLRRERVRGRIVEIGATTVVDALRMMMSEGSTPADLPDRYGLVPLHRFEMLRNAEVFTQTLQVLKEASATTRLVLPARDIERHRIDELGLTSLFDDRFMLMANQPYARFLPILDRASFVGDGLRRAAAGVCRPRQTLRDPRETTEAQQGLGENVLLTGLDMDGLRRVIEHREDYRSPRAARPVPPDPRDHGSA